jgi:cystathionine gamma-lyase
MSNFKGLSTKLIHALEPEKETGAVTNSICLASTFAQHGPGVLPGLDSEISLGRGFEYARTGNPTRNAFEIAFRACEDAKYVVAFASGLAASNAIFSSLLKVNDHLISMDDVYGGTQRFLRRIAGPSYGYQTTFMPFDDIEAVEKAILPNTKLIWLESPTNPTLKVTDIAKVAELAKRRNLLLVVDATFLTPVLMRPLELGADIVMHSATKYIGGHSDVVMGVASTNNSELYSLLKFHQNSLGGTPSPLCCYLATRGLKTLVLRMERHCSNAMKVAEFLSAHPLVEKVLYPGLPSHPQHEIAKKQQKGYGGMITFYIKGELANARRFLESTQLFICAESLGAVESLAESPAIMTHASVPADVRAQLNISDTLIRLSVGIEEVEDLIQDLDNALKAASQI